LNIPNLLQTSLDHVLLKAISDFGEGVVVLDSPQIIYTNEAFSKMTGYSEKELVDLSSFFNLIPADKKKQINDYLSRPSDDNKIAPRLETVLLKKDGKQTHVEITTNSVSEGTKTTVVLVVRDITDQKRMASALKQSDQFEKLITTLSSQFINLAPHLIDEGINNAIRSIGEFIGVDRILMLSVASDKVTDTSFEWCAPGIEKASEVNNVLFSKFSVFFEKMKDSKVMYVSSPDELPAEAVAEKEFLKSRGVKSIVAVPMITDGVLKGLLTFSTLKLTKKWTDEDLVLFRITAEMFANVIERKSSHQALKQNEDKFKELFNNAIDGIFIYELSEEGIPGKFIEVNDVACSKLGYSREELLKMTPLDIAAPETVSEIEKTIKKLLNNTNLTYEKIHMTKNGQKIPIEINAHIFNWNKQKVVQSIARDITDRKRAEETIRRQAYYDVLTNLPNRTLFKDRLEQGMKNAHHNKQMLAVMVLDLDRFKNINETLGHLLGDKLLVAVSERLLGVLHENETIARFGGDEFALLLPQLTQIEDATDHAQKIIELLAAPFKLNEHELHVTTSIGVSFYPDDGESSELVLKNAETAMYRAKDQGRNNYQLYASGMNVSAFKQLLMENSLRRALEKEEFVVYYQPQISLTTQKVIGAEALVRWQHPDLGLVFPNEFIGLAEETGLIVPIGEWIIKKVCEQSKKWQADGFEKMCIGVNLSARQFQQLNLVSTIAKIIADTGLDPQCLGLEVTESIAMKNADFTIAALNEFKKMKIHLSLDDFGTGYSSLSYLKRFPLETLKIDRSFVRDITTDPNDAAIVNAVVALAHSLKLDVVAEGVETEGQLTFLKNHQCDSVQGYIYSHPLSEINFLKFIKEYKK
jgi:diguanylate cyclase (GGDEF)-like protein/PAS domain S-box-containing protein